MTPLLDEARRLHPLGYRIIPLSGKVPTIQEWEIRQPTIGELAGELEHATGIGHVSCESIAVADFDGEQWEGLYGFFTDEFPQLEEGPAVRTGRGRMHAHFRAPGMGAFTNEKFSRADLKGVIELRGNRSNNVLPPSRHPDTGRVYTWERDPELCAFPEIPFATVHGFLSKWAGKTGTNGKAPPIGDTIPDGSRNDTFTSLAGSMRRRNMSKAAILAALMEENAKCRPPLDEREIAAIVASVFRYPPAPDLGAPIHRTDLGNARRLRRQHGSSLRYCHPWRKWLAWDGRRWEEDATARVLRLGRDVVTGMLHEAAGLQGDERESLAKWALQSESERRLQAMASLCASEPGIPVLPGDLDKGAWLLNTPSGTVDLRTGALRPHRPEDLLTKIAGAPYDPAASCPRFERFVLEIMNGSKALADFLRRFFGYAATGDCRERRLAILHGSGRNGKSTLMSIVGEALGDYATKTPTSTFLAKRGDSIPNDVAMLKGARLAFAAETAEGRRLDEALVKEMTGRERLTARFLHAEFFSFLPEFVPVLASNHKPIIEGTDNGIWDRILFVPFGVRFEGEGEDMNLINVLRGELPGILGWIVQGALEWQEKGLGEPKAVLDATGGYREESDRVGEFIAERCLLGPGMRAAASDLNAAYRGWAQARGDEPLDSIRFGERLREKGLSPSKGQGGKRFWEGIGFKAP